MTTLLDAAVRYAVELGWHVHPCALTKEPITEHGYLDATTDETQIREWWAQWPGASIGVSCSIASGLLAIDVDPRNGGLATFARLEENLGKLPDTPEQHSGGHGLHVVLQHPGTATVGKLGPGVDIKSAGYIIVAPSPHPSRRRYRWDELCDPRFTRVAEIPETWLGAIVGLESPTYEASGIHVGDSVLAHAFDARGWLIKRIDPSRIAVQCPWAAEHTTSTKSRTDAVLFAPRSGSALGWFHCSHSHCSGRTIGNVYDELGPEALVKAADAVMAMVGDEDEERLAIIEEGRK